MFLNLSITLVLIMVSAICKAISDRLIHRFNISKFSNLKNEQFWNPELSWTNKYIDGDYRKGLKKNVFVPFTDAWHLFNSIGITAFLLTTVFTVQLDFVYKIIEFFVLGIIYVLIFNLFYNKIFKK